jgi:hypothetical protein
MMPNARAKGASVAERGYGDMVRVSSREAIPRS